VAGGVNRAFREWETPLGHDFAELKTSSIPPRLNGVNDEMIPVSTSYRLAENLNASCCSLTHAVTVPYSSTRSLLPDLLLHSSSDSPVSTF